MNKTRMLFFKPKKVTGCHYFPPNDVTSVHSLQWQWFVLWGGNAHASFYGKIFSFKKWGRCATQLWKIYSLSYLKLLCSFLYHISPVVLRKYRYGRKSKKIFTTKPIVTTNRESYTQNISLNTVFTLHFSLQIQCQEQDLLRQSFQNDLLLVIQHWAGFLVPCQWDFPARRGNWVCRTATPAQLDPHLLLWEKPAP